MTDASSAIAKLRETHKRWVNFDLSMLDEEAEIARSLPALLECAEALEIAAEALFYCYDVADYPGDSSPQAAALRKARAALDALSKDTP
jgi:hypothetical protein